MEFDALIIQALAKTKKTSLLVFTLDVVLYSYAYLHLVEASTFTSQKKKFVDPVFSLKTLSPLT